MTRREYRLLLVVALLGLAVACSNFALFSPSAIQTKDAPPAASPSPSASATPAPTASATPADPCKPVIGVNLSGPLSPVIGSVFKVDVTPVSPAGPLEGALDYCNISRFPSVESATANIRCVGNCNGFGPQFLAQGVGPFSVTIRVEGASATFAGTVTR